MGKFTNLEIHTEPETTLFLQETDVILAIIDQVLSSFDTYPTKGTFILDGQKKSTKAKAQCLLRFDLEEGVSQSSHGTSADVAAGAINYMLQFCPGPDCCAWPDSGIYRTFLEPDEDDSSEWWCLILNTTYGRFLMSCCFDPIDSIDGSSYVIAMALAEAFAQMGKEDKVLQWSVEHVHTQATDLENNTIALVQSLFHDCTLPALQAWKAWHEPANTSGDLTLFFE